MSALRFLKKSTVSSTVSTVSLTDVFESDFNVHKILFREFTLDSGTATFYVKLIDLNGTVISNTDYQQAGTITRDDTTFTERRSTGSSNGILSQYSIDDATEEALNGYLYVYNARQSAHTFVTGNFTVRINGLLQGIKTIGVLKNPGQVSGIELSLSSNSFDSGEIEIYGMSEL